MFLVVRAELVSVCCQLTAICPGCSFCLPCWCLWRQHLVLSALLFCEALSGGGKADWRRRRTHQYAPCRGTRGGCGLSETSNVWGQCVQGHLNSWSMCMVTMRRLAGCA